VAQQGGKNPLLINLSEDIAEAKDLAADRPEKVKELQALYDKWNAEQAPARWLPGDNPAKAAKKKKKKAK
jgi:hypothetical protein